MLDSYAFLFVPLGVDLNSKILFFLISSGYISIDFILTRLKEIHLITPVVVLLLIFHHQKFKS